MTCVNAGGAARPSNEGMTHTDAPRLWFALCSILALAALPAAFVVRADDPPATAVEFEPLTVTAPVEPLDRSLQMLRLLVEQSAPCLGCDAVLQPRTSRTVDFLSYLLLPAEPPQVDEATRLAHEIKLQDSPDLDYLRP